MWNQAHRRFAMFFAFAILFAMCFPSLSHAQESTPAPAESSCSVSPRDPAFFTAIQGTPVVPDASRESLIAAYQSSDRAATAEQVAALQETMDQFRACANAGDFARVASLFSDSHWQRAVGDVPGIATLFAEEAGATPTVVPAGQQMTSAIVQEPRSFVDGRIAALVRFDIPQSDDGGIHLLVFTRIGEQWLIDEVIAGLDDDLATPMPDEDERVRY